jgi:hypothetical protein
MKDVLDEVGVTAMATRTLPAGDDIAATAIVELRAPLAARSADGGGAIPGRLYRLFTRLILSRDVAWLAPFAGSG